MNINNNLEVLNSEQFANRLFVDVRTVQRWVKEGLPHEFEGKDLRFVWKTGLLWWATNKYRGSAVVDRNSSTPSKAVSEAKILATKARRDAIRLAKEEGTLVELQEVESEWTRSILNCRGRLLTISTRLRGPLGPEVAKRVEEEVFLALTEISKGVPNE